ncbi:MAG: ParB/RepB/Spo0J family partition protein [Candidatus Margulisbacteria bacterium]|nr:ParB/RepB/Spo0J family partition protein [Candidatus Margulisiibacteriota bacterium]
MSKKFKMPVHVAKEALSNNTDDIVIQIPLDSIQCPPQVRKYFNKESIKQLAKDIDTHGLHHPIVVSKEPDKHGTYNLIVGGRRYRAYEFLKLKNIPSRIVSHKKSKEDIIRSQISENKHRDNLTPLEEADAIYILKSELSKTSKMTQKEMAKLLNISLRQTERLFRIYRIPQAHKEYLASVNASYRDIDDFLALTDDEKEFLIINGSPPKASKSSASKTRYDTSDGIKNYKNSIALRMKIHNRESQEDLERKIKICEDFIEEARKRIENE